MRPSTVAAVLVAAATILPLQPLVIDAATTAVAHSTSTPSAASAAKSLPSEVLDLENWYITLPTGAKGDPTTVDQPDLQTYTSPHFQLNAAKNGVVFTAPAGGVTTKNSKYPRSELREMNGQKKAAWSNKSGVHTLKMNAAVTELPKVKPELVTAQIHDGKSDVMQIRHEGSRLMVQYADGKKEVTLDPNYKLGTAYDVTIEATKSRVQVYYNGAKKFDLPLKGSTWYFKAGAYLQSNTSKGDKPTAIGQVVLNSLTVTHSK
jgi:Alginate lyase